jgi:hypothetical protein
MEPTRLNPDLMRAVEGLNYRVTAGDLATRAGLDINLAQQGLLALASEAGGHLQVAESGEIVYLFPPNFRAILRNKYFRLRLQEWWERVWRVLFYLIRISFGIILILSLVIILVTIAAIVIALSFNNDNNSDSGDSFGGIPEGLFSPDIFWIFIPDTYGSSSTSRRAASRKNDSMNFLEAVFSFLFGDGNPNADLEQRRWRQIGAVIQKNRGAVVAEQIAPYLDNLGQGFAREYEDYMLPVLTRFNGKPEVSPEGAIVYHFPDLQTTAANQIKQSVPAYLKEKPWRFSHASSGQLMAAASLGAVNFVGALVLGYLLAGGTATLALGGAVSIIQAIYWLLFGYGTGFLGIPLVRYFWLQRHNRKLAQRNEERQQRAVQMTHLDPDLRAKLNYARQFAGQTVIQQEDLVYTTERDMLEQDLEQADRIDAEWQERLNASNPPDR